MKILRAIGLALCILLLKFILMRGVFGAFEGALVAVFNVIHRIAESLPANPSGMFIN